MTISRLLLTTLATSSFASVAYADVSVLANGSGGIRFYGILDAAVGTEQHSLSADSQYETSVNLTNPVKNNGTVPSSVTGLLNGGISSSRLGIKGNTDVGNGVKSFFALKSGINVTTGRLSDDAPCLANNARTPIAACSGSSVSGQLFSRQAFISLSENSLGSITLGT